MTSYYRPSSAHYGERARDNRFYHNRRVARVAAPRAPNPDNWTAYEAAHPARAAWIRAKAPTFDFAANMLIAVGQFGDLTENQHAAVDRCVARDQDRQEGQNSALQTPTVDASALRAVFSGEATDGRARAKIMVAGVAFSKAPETGRNPGAIYVKIDGGYVGKIVGEAFTPARDCTPEMTARVVAAIDDPAGEVHAHAERTARMLAEAAAEGRPLSMPCGCCGLTLTDPVSIARGIGPICAGRWGF